MKCVEFTATDGNIIVEELGSYLLYKTDKKLFLSLSYELIELLYRVSHFVMIGLNPLPSRY